MDGHREVALEGTTYAFDRVSEMECAWDRPGTHLLVARHGNCIVGASPRETNHQGRGRTSGTCRCWCTAPAARSGSARS